MATHIRIHAQICRRRANGDALLEEHELMQRGDAVDRFTPVYYVTLDRFNFQGNLKHQMKQRLLRQCYHIIFGDGETSHQVTMERQAVDRLVLRVATEAERLLRTKLYSHLRKILIRMVLEVFDHRREQWKMEAVHGESMEVSEVFEAVPASRAAIDSLVHEILDFGDGGRVICKC